MKESGFSLPRRVLLPLGLTLFAVFTLGHLATISLTHTCHGR